MNNFGNNFGIVIFIEKQQKKTNNRLSEGFSLLSIRDNKNITES